MPNPKRILAIDPGTREMGVAVLEGKDLLYHGVHVFLHRQSPHAILKEGRTVILRMIRDFDPNVLVVEKTFFANNRNAALVNVLADEIQALGRRKGLRVLSFAPSTVKKRITGNGHASKSEVAAVLVARYPQLKGYTVERPKWKQKFHANMFDALALAVVARQAR
ncbi:MAG: crossover junction endodeoxyribonuclease RuvC [Candidatus Omnitrophica bacterium]|nr:Crossover junction endodeoxyribonuclease RuvC [bacterium]NUN97422.1 crossover junction endodeoxyribonuclease RuvC [Candidatus Omnitrophota bacterium]